MKVERTGTVIRLSYSVLFAAVTAVFFYFLISCNAGDFAVHAESRKPEIVDSVYRISDADELIWFSELVNGELTDGTERDPDAKGTLTGDIDMNGKKFTPVGKEYGREFTGTFDGGGHVVKNLKFDEKDKNLGLFGNVKNAVIKNVTVSGSMKGSHNSLGGIVGKSYDTTIISGCGNLMNITNEKSSGSAGGIIATSDNKVFVSDCFNRGNVKSGKRASGIVADASFGNLENCYNTGNVEGEQAIGVGSSFGISYKNCYNAGEVSSNGKVTPYSIGGSKFSEYINTHYMKGLAQGDPDSKSKEISKEEMAASSFVETLGKDKWKVDRAGSVNRGFPILLWENAGEAEAEKLGIPQNLKWDISKDKEFDILNEQFKASWDKVRGAEDYRLKLYRDGEDEPVFISGKIRSTEFDLIREFAKIKGNPAKYRFTVTAEGDGENYTDGEESGKDGSGFEFDPGAFVGSPETLVWNSVSKSAVWSTVPGADFYDVTLYCDDRKVVDYLINDDMFDKNETRISINFLHNMSREGEYSFSVRAGKNLGKAHSGKELVAGGALAMSKKTYFEAQNGESVKISSVEDWMNIVNLTEKGTEYKTEADAQNALWARKYELTADLDFSKYVKEDKELTQCWGNINAMFNGTLDGKGHKITGLKLAEGEGGLFSYIGPSGVVKNLRIENPNALFNDNAGILCRYNYGKIKNCGVENANITADLGAIVAGMLSRNFGMVEDSYVEGGKLVAYSSTANGHAGFVGNNFGRIRRCYSSMDVKTNSFNAGGFSGWADKSGKYYGTFENCFCVGNVDAEKGWSGGFVGRVNSKDVTFKNCYASGRVRSNQKPDKAFGFTGSLSGEGMADVIGETIFDEEIPKSNFVNCFYLKENTPGENPKSGATAKTAAEMKEPRFMAMLGVDWIRSDGKNNALPYLADLPAPSKAEHKKVSTRLLIAKYDVKTHKFMKDGEILEVMVENSANPRVIDVMDAAAAQNKLKYEYVVNPLYGSFIESINGSKMSAPDGWMFTVNDKLSNVSASLREVKDGDRILWYQGMTQNLFEAPSWERMIKGNETTEKDFIPIKTAEDLVALTDKSTDLTKKYRLTGNIDMKGVSFSGIGSKEKPFEGSFDGGGFTISSLTIERPDSHNIGLFNFIKGAEISDLNVKNADIKGKYDVGILVGVAGVEVAKKISDKSVGNKISNCGVSGNVTSVNNDISGQSLGSYAGGLIGFNDGDENTKTGARILSSVDGCRANVKVTAGSLYAGGLVGGNFGYITNSKAYGRVDGNKIAGGFAGGNRGGIYSCASYGPVKGMEDIGGFLGHNYDTVERCYSLGNVKGKTEQIGGFAGSGRNTVKSCISAGIVECERDDSTVGGFIGHYAGRIAGLPKDVHFKQNYGWSVSSFGRELPAIGNRAGTKELTENEKKVLKQTAVIDKGVLQKSFRDLFNLTLTGEGRILEEEENIVGDNGENDDKKPEPQKDNVNRGNDKESKRDIASGKKKAGENRSTEKMKKGNPFGKDNVRTLSKVKRVKIKKLNNGRLKISWSRVKKSDGYQIRYAKKSSFKRYRLIGIKGGKSVKKVFTKHLRKKMIYIQVRCYKKVNGIIEYSGWSKAKKTL